MIPKFNIGQVVHVAADHPEDSYYGVIEEITEDPVGYIYQVSGADVYESQLRHLYIQELGRRWHKVISPEDF